MGGIYCLKEVKYIGITTACGIHGGNHIDKRGIIHFHSSIPHTIRWFLWKRNISEKGAVLEICDIPHHFPKARIKTRDKYWTYADGVEVRSAKENYQPDSANHEYDKPEDKNFKDTADRMTLIIYDFQKTPRVHGCFGN